MTEPKPKPELNDAAIYEILNTKLSAGDADSGWMLALIGMKLLPLAAEIAGSIAQAAGLLGEIERGLRRIDTALAPDLAGQSLSERLREIGSAIEHAIKVFRDAR